MPAGRPAKRRHPQTLDGRREKQAHRDERAALGNKSCIRTGAAFNTNYNDAVLPFTIGEMDQVCSHQHCGALNFAGEKVGSHFSICCGNGKVVFPQDCMLRPVPPLLLKMLTEDNPPARNFRDNILNYNSALAFASLKANVDFKGRSGGPYTYRIHGNVYTLTSNLKAATNPAFSQLFILDPQAALNERMGRKENDRCRADLMQTLDSLLRHINPYAAAYKMIKEVEEREGPCEQLQLMFLKDDTKDPRRYNLPLANEVSVIFTGPDGEPPEHIDFVVHLLDGSLMQISHTSPNSDPMAYPILFPNGERGWHENLKHHPDHRTGKHHRLTMRDFYSARLAVRPGFSLPHNAGKLLQQYIVLSYVKVESNNLFFLKHNQSKLRVEKYSGLMDFLASDAKERNLPPGRVCILPSTFINSPRNMQQNYQDAMAIVNKFGKPDLFITVTCNPKWPEITENLQFQQRAENRPDLVARVFNLKLKELLADVKKGSVFGKVCAMIHVIEFQKRGLPHAHILIILARDYKIRGREMIDEIVSAELPDRISEPHLYEQVVKHMVHGPCGMNVNKPSPCMDKNKCTKDYPKHFVSETLENVDGYPLYRRRVGETFTKSGCTLDNRWIVPHNKYLVHKFDAHINVEICSSIRSVKYLYKYVYKGHDCINMELCSTSGNASTRRDHDEIMHYVDGRTVTPPEAAWRLFSFKMHQQSHNIVRLPVHLPLDHNVIFSLGNVADVLSRSTETALTAFFQMCSTNPAARELTYTAVGEKYRFDVSVKKWVARVNENSNVISRMYGVSPQDRERYFLRLLLLNVSGPTSFEDLRTFKGVIHETFFESAKSRGLLPDDEEWSRCLSEASVYKMPASMRQLFTVICVFCQPQNPDVMELFQRHEQDLSEDFVKSHGPQVGRDMCLSAIADLLRLHLKSLADYGLPSPRRMMSAENVVDTSAQLARGMEFYSKLNQQQRTVVDIILDACVPHGERVRRHSNSLFFLDGPAGTGKTFVYSTLIDILTGRGKTVFPVALTGIAATLLPGGRTLHSRFKLPIPLNETSTSSIKPGDYNAGQLLACDLIIWDEAPMAPGMALQVIDRLMRDITRKSKPFGGKTFLLAGDFRQCLPIVPRGARAAITSASIQRSPLWCHFHQLSLHRNMRAIPSELEFADWLLRLGEGRLPSCDTFGDDSFQIPDNCMADGPLEDILFGDVLDPVSWTDYAHVAILTPCNEASFELNHKILEKIEGNFHTYKSIDSVECESDEEARNYPMEFINNQTPTGMPPHELHLKIGAPVMLLRNLNPGEGLCNGTRMIVTKLHDNMIEAKLLSDVRKTVFIPRIDCVPTSGDLSMPFKLKRRQFPLRTAFCMTITKAQGQTFDKIGLFLPAPAFGHGQIYVAFSRVRRFSDVKVQLGDHPNQGLSDDNWWTQNVVYKEILQQR